MIVKLCEVSVKKFAKKAKVIFFIVDIAFEVKYQAKGEMMKKIVLALAISSAFAGFAMADNYDEEISGRSIKSEILRDAWANRYQKCGYSNSLEDVLCRLGKYTIVRDKWRY